MLIDIPETKKVAEFVLAKIKEKDPEQYDAFLQAVVTVITATLLNLLQTGSELMKSGPM